MPKNVMKMLKPSPNYGRNDFDLSHRTVHTANFGELIPTFCVETLPKDKIKVRVSDLVRAQPMVTSPFLRAKQHIDVWFVPYNMMWSRFNEFLVDKSEPGSSVFNDRLYVPSITTKDLYNALDDWSQLPSKVDIHGYMPRESICRNLDLLGYAGTLMMQRVIDQDSNYPVLSMNLWRLLAYNLIWYREYRQQYYDSGTHLLPSALGAMDAGVAALFNMDILRCDTPSNANLVTGISSGLDLLECLIQPRYRCWKKDIYTGLMPSTQFGNVSNVTSLSDIGRVCVNSNISTTPNILQGSRNSNYELILDNGGGNSPVTISNLKSNFDILALRKSEAIQKWRENSLRAGNQVEDNFEAHFGVKPKTHMELHPKHVASFDAPLNIGDVNAQANTLAGDNGLLGDVAGKGIMSFNGQDEFTFETNDYGVLMAIYSILPEAEYNGNNIDRMNALLEREDYFFPEYENLGLEAVDSSVISLNSQQNFGLGFAPRYFGYKQKHDRCVGSFENFQSFAGMFRHWCSPKYDVDDAINNGNLPLSTLYVNPNIFGVNFNVTDFRTTPQFLVDMYCDVEAIRQMSVSGMPGY